jgi:two-component system, NtrC family, response regulator AtoC
MTSSAQPAYLGMPAIVVSPAMLQVIDLVQRVGQTNATVLITGESGVGKELVARAVHHHSLRCHKAWVDVSCAALPEHLVESELFGYEKGAFSGADGSKPGLFELAHNGTLFLDEIGELESRMQVKLLRVLDGTPYYRLGGVRKVTVDVRIVAATNQNLEEMVLTGRFRSDLYHRLSQIQLRIPPLRERLDDIVPIAQHFLSQYKPGLSFTNEALRALRSFNWPGNIRELRNVVTKAAILARGETIGASELALDSQCAFGGAPMQSLYSAINGNGNGNGNGKTHGPVDGPNLEGIERNTIMRVLAETNGHQQRAADLLGISRRTLSRKLKLYGMESARQPCVS